MYAAPSSKINPHAAAPRSSVLLIGVGDLGTNRSYGRDAVVGVRHDVAGLARLLGEGGNTQVVHDPTAVEMLRAIRGWAAGLARSPEAEPTFVFVGPGHTDADGCRGLCGSDGRPSGAGVVPLARIAEVFSRTLPGRAVHVLLDTAFRGDGPRTVTPEAGGGHDGMPLLRRIDPVVFGGSFVGVSRGETLRTSFSLALEHALATETGPIDHRTLAWTLGRWTASDGGSVSYAGPLRPAAGRGPLAGQRRVILGAEARQYNAEIEGYYGLMAPGPTGGDLVLITGGDVGQDGYAVAGDYWTWGGNTPSALPTDFEAASTPKAQRPTKGTYAAWELHDYVLFTGTANNAPPTLPSTGQFYRIGLKSGGNTTWKDCYLWRHGGSNGTRVHEWWARSSALSADSSGALGIAHGTGAVVRHAIATSAPTGASDWYKLSTTGTVI